MYIYINDKNLEEMAEASRYNMLKPHTLKAYNKLTRNIIQDIKAISPSYRTKLEKELLQEAHNLKGTIEYYIEEMEVKPRDE